METQPVGRRQMLRGVGVVAGGVAVGTVGLSSPAMADDDDDDHDHDKHRGLLGAWKITRQDDGDPATATGVGSFASGGVALYEDINPVGPSFSGSFAQGGRKRFRSLILSGSRAGESFPDSPALTTEVHTEGTRDKNTISGTYTAAAFDAVTGEAVFPPVTGTFSGTRIEA